MFCTLFQFLALIALALVAGFSVNVSEIAECAVNNTNYSTTLKISYPLTEVKATVVTNETETRSSKAQLDEKGIPMAAEFFVAWGALTLFYCIIAVLVYMLVTANDQLEKVFDVLVVTVSTTTTIECVSQGNAA